MTRAPAGIPPGSLLGRERPPPRPLPPLCPGSGKCRTSRCSTGALVAVLHSDGIAIARRSTFEIWSQRDGVVFNLTVGKKRYAFLACARKLALVCFFFFYENAPEKKKEHPRPLVYPLIKHWNNIARLPNAKNQKMEWKQEIATKSRLMFRVDRCVEFGR